MPQLWSIIALWALLYPWGGTLRFIKEEEGAEVVTGQAGTKSCL
jgi:hypothetical protein